MDKKIPIEKKVLSKNDEIAAEIRHRLDSHRILTLNLVSSPGSGKTSLLEKTFKTLGDKLNMAVIAGDVQTENDARRLIEAGGKQVRPIVTGGACHLDAKMVTEQLDLIELEGLDILFIENVGNLVCPSSYDLGEDMKVVLMSTTEGDDKPLKYPSMFRRSKALIINKTDLLGRSNFDMEKARQNAWNINPELKMFDLSCYSGAGLHNWYTWITNLVAKKKDRDS